MGPLTVSYATAAPSMAWQQFVFHQATDAERTKNNLIVKPLDVFFPLPSETDVSEGAICRCCLFVICVLYIDVSRHPQRRNSCAQGGSSTRHVPECRRAN